MMKFRKRNFNKAVKKVAPALPAPPQGCGCGGSSEQRSNVVRKVINKRKKRK